MIHHITRNPHIKLVEETCTLTGWIWVTPLSRCSTDTDRGTDQREVLITIKLHFTTDCERIPFPPTVCN